MPNALQKGGIPNIIRNSLSNSKFNYKATLAKKMHDSCCCPQSALQQYTFQLLHKTKLAVFKTVAVPATTENTLRTAFIAVRHSKTTEAAAARALLTYKLVAQDSSHLCNFLYRLYSIL